MPETKQLSALFFVCAAIVSTIWPAEAHAQRYRSARRGHVGTIGFVRGCHYPPLLAAFPWYQYPVFGYPPYGFYPVAYAGSAVRLQVAPRDTEVYVDGYFAGSADNFDGFFQRLRLPPGEHQIDLHLDGYRSLRQSLYLTPGSTYKIRHTMVPLATGETGEPRPLPATPPPASPPTQKTWPQAPAGMPGEASVFGTLSLRVQPSDAEVLIDGERWQWPQSQDRLVVHVPEGRHRIEVRKEGHESFSTEATVRRGETTTVNISLSPI